MTAETSSIKRILVPLDQTRLGEGKLHLSEAQARAFGAELVLLHVIPSSPSPAGTVTLAESQAQTYLDAIAARLRVDGVEAHPLLHYGPVVETILDQIVAQQADLVVIGSNIRHGISRLLLGSVAEEIIARAACPVLLVRPAAMQEERRLAVRDFSDDLARTGPTSQHRLGLRTVEMARIVGSVGRSPSLDEQFRVRGMGKPEQERYDRVRKAMEDGKPMPPIELYKLGYGYYVLDGNHRVAGARALGWLDMEAEVTEFVPLGDPQGERVFAERRAFERETGLSRIGVAQPGNYRRLGDVIRQYAQDRGLPDRFAAARAWESEVYRPVAKRIRALRLAQHCPGQRTADIFVQVADLRDAEAEREGQPMEWEKALRLYRSRRRTEP